MVVDSAIPKQHSARHAEYSSGDIEELIRPSAFDQHGRGRRGGFDRLWGRRGGFGGLGSWRCDGGRTESRCGRRSRAPADQTSQQPG